ncbi:unnamed protein product [Scytosiphon promiscuus]
MGVEKEILTPAPAGAQRPKKGQKVTVHCTGYGKNRDMSQKFWSTKDPGQVKNAHARTPTHQHTHIKQVVALEASCSCCQGRPCPLVFPSWGIMPDSTLCFEIEVLSIE